MHKDFLTICKAPTDLRHASQRHFANKILISALIHSSKDNMALKIMIWSPKMRTLWKEAFDTEVP